MRTQGDLVRNGLKCVTNQTQLTNTQIVLGPHTAQPHSAPRHCYHKTGPQASTPLNHLQITRAGFWRKGNKVYYSSDAEHRENQPLKLCSPTSERKYLPFKGKLRAQLDRATKCMSTMAAGLGSPGVQHHFSEAVCLSQQVCCSGGQRKIRGRRLPGLIEEKRN
jgi:hypothetical protein